MGVFYSGWAKGSMDNAGLEKKKSKMQLEEEDADAIKIKLIRDFSEAGSQGLQPYLNLILRMDNVINSALEFVDLLEHIKIEDEKTHTAINKRYHKLINNIINMAVELKKTIKSMRDNPEDVFESTTMIHEIENEIDLIFRQTLEELYSNQDLDIRTLLRVRDSIKLLEELADRIHDVADLLRVLRYY